MLRRAEDCLRNQYSRTALGIIARSRKSGAVLITDAKEADEREDDEGHEDDTAIARSHRMES